jgi:Protein of unknown function (DUF3486)
MRSIWVLSAYILNKIFWQQLSLASFFALFQKPFQRRASFWTVVLEHRFRNFFAFLAYFAVIRPSFPSFASVKFSLLSHFRLFCVLCVPLRLNFLFFSFCGSGELTLFQKPWDNSPMIDQKVIETPVVDTSENEKIDSIHTLIGKIARLPHDIRNQLNQRLLDNKTGPEILAWLNELPAVKEVLNAQFGGVPVSLANLSNWRLGGFKRWLQNQEPVAQIRELKDLASDISGAGSGQIAIAAATVISGKILEHLKNTPGEKMNTSDLSKAGFAVAGLANVEQNAVRLENEKIRIQQRDEQLLIQRDKHQRDVIAIGLRLLKDERARLIEAMPVSYAEKNELLGIHTFGKDWIPREVPVPSEAAPSDPVDTQAPS